MNRYLFPVIITIAAGYALTLDKNLPEPPRPQSEISPPKVSKRPSVRAITTNRYKEQSTAKHTHKGSPTVKQLYSRLRSAAQDQNILKTTADHTVWELLYNQKHLREGKCIPRLLTTGSGMGASSLITNHSFDDLEIRVQESLLSTYRITFASQDTIITYALWEDAPPIPLRESDRKPMVAVTVQTKTTIYDFIHRLPQDFVSNPIWQDRVHNYLDAWRKEVNR